MTKTKPTRSLAVTTRKGQEYTVETPYTDTEALSKLRALVAPGGALAGDSFAHSLARKRYKLYPDQAVWTHILVVRASAPAPAAAAPVAVLPAIREFLDAAASDTPALHLECAEGGKVKVALKGKRSKYHGEVWITDGGEYPDEKVYGTIGPDGDLIPGKFRSSPPLPASALALLEEVEEDPVAGAVAFAAHTGNCCFCNLTLRDDRSKAVGYGQKCAANHSLPWGKQQRHPEFVLIRTTSTYGPGPTAK